MRYLCQSDIESIDIEWREILTVVRETVKLIGGGEYEQPLKPYLRFGDMKNRIIAMPAYLGGKTPAAGLKWIASFPDNIFKGLPRAHSIIILNDPETGEPKTILNSAMVSEIRTAGVTGYILDHFFNTLDQMEEQVNFGIIGYGPIGQMHLRLLHSHFRNRVKGIYVYDLNKVEEGAIQKKYKSEKIHVVESWQEAFDNSTVFITCTVSDKRYITKSPKKGCIYINVSLRDFELDFFQELDLVIVDNWKEVCRENTDVEKAFLAGILEQEKVVEIQELTRNPILQKLCNPSIMFNPMGMAVFDIAVAQYITSLAMENNKGVEL